MRTLTLALLSLGLGTMARAETYTDGGTHVLDWSTTEAVEVSEATTLELRAGARVEPSTDANGIQATGGSTVILSAGYVEAGTGPGQRIALASWNGDVEVYDGVVLLGGVSTGTTGGKGAHIDAQSPHRCRIEGGQFLGRDNPTHGGPGATIRGDFEIAGGSFVGGHGDATSGGTGLWLLGGAGSIDGAEFVGGNGGLIGKTGLLVGSTELTIHGGIFRGGSGAQSSGAGLRAENSSFVIVRSGDFRAGDSESFSRTSLVVRDDSVVELWGGTFDGDFALTGKARLFAYGRGLTFEAGVLRGTLRDGSPIEMRVRLQDEAEVVTVDGVPTERATFGDLKSRY